MEKKLNIIFQGSRERKSLLDYAFLKNGVKKPLVIFVHGFKGFKDWGHFDLLMDYFAQEGFGFLKFNFSYNGGTTENPIDFPDLEAFGNNNLTTELDDLGVVIDWAIEHLPDEEIDKDKIYLIGHSRGGGVAILKAAEDKRIKKLVTWAAVADFLKRLPDTKLQQQWQKEGVLYIENARTKQQMPMYYQYYEDLINNKDRLDVLKAAAAIDIPWLILHGINDESVNVKEAEALKEAQPKANMLLIGGANHVFGASHPYPYTELQSNVMEAILPTVEFLRR
jgi:pimeloyl-ACP methyl ester carboxylesterase